MEILARERDRVVNNFSRILPNTHTHTRTHAHMHVRPYTQLQVDISCKQYFIGCYDDMMNVSLCACVCSSMIMLSVMIKYMAATTAAAPAV